MSTDNETWRDAEPDNANRDGNQDGGYYRREDSGRSYNRDSNYNREKRPRITGERTQRSCYNRYDGNNSDRPNYNSGDRLQRPYNRDENSYNREGADRPYRPRVNRDQQGMNREQSGDRSYNQRYNRDFNDSRGGYNRNSQSPQRSYNREDRPWRNNNFGDENNNRARFNKPTGSGYSGNSGGYSGNRGGYNNSGGGYDRPQRPRFSNGGNRPQGGYARPVRRTNDYDPNAKYTQRKQIEYREQLTDPDEPIRLNKYLANAGVCSRREADEFITSGAVSVNGEVVTELGTKIKRSDLVKFHDGVVSAERKMYVLLNKPKDCVTTSDDPQSRLTVMELIKGSCTERIYPVGRLDRNTTGVLLLTNDGDLASKLTHPQFLKKKIYHVTTDKRITKADMEQIAAGITLEDGTEVRADAISYTDEERFNQIGIEIHSGQNRIVRRIFEHFGYKVTKLDRVYFAGLTKKGLKRGDWRYLTQNEVNFLRMGSFT